MTSLSEVTFSKIVRTQAKWKLQIFSQALLALVILQVVFSILTLDGSSQSSFGSNFLDISIRSFTLDSILIITCIWALITGLIANTKAYRFDDVSVVSTRTSSSIATIIVLGLFSVIGTLTMLASFYIQTSIFNVFKGISISPDSILPSFENILFCFSALFLFTAIGYTISVCFNNFRYGGWIFLAGFITYYLIRFLFPSSEGTTVFMATPSAGMIAAIFFIVALFLYSLAVLISSKSEVK